MESLWGGEVLVGIVTLAVVIVTVGKAAWNTLFGKLAGLVHGVLQVAHRPQPCPVLVEVTTERRRVACRTASRRCR
jgi:hypothetical protein